MALVPKHILKERERKKVQLLLIEGRLSNRSSSYYLLPPLIYNIKVDGGQEIFARSELALRTHTSYSTMISELELAVIKRFEPRFFCVSAP